MYVYTCVRILIPGCLMNPKGGASRCCSIDILVVSVQHVSSTTKQPLGRAQHDRIEWACVYVSTYIYKHIHIYIYI